MRNGSHIPNDGEIEADCLQRADGGFASRTRAFHSHFNFFEAVPHRLTRGILGHELRGISIVFARTFEPDFAGTRPSDHLARQVRDSDDRIVKSGEDMCDSRMNVFAALRFDDFRLFNVVAIER